MLLQILFFVSFYPILLILFYFLATTADPKKNHIFGVTIQNNWRSLDSFHAVIASYKKELRWIMLILALIPLVTCFIPGFSISLTIWMVWLLALLTIPFYPFIKANGKLKELPRDQAEESQAGTYHFTEMKLAGDIRRVRFLPFALPIILNLGVGIYSLYYFGQKELWAIAWILVVFALIAPLLYIMAIWTDRLKLTVISYDSDINISYGRAIKNVWKNTWLLCSWLNLAYVAITALVLMQDFSNMNFLIWSCIVYTTAILIILFLAFSKIQNLDTLYQEKCDTSLISSDDNNWIGGVFYYNKLDRHSIVPKRVGVGTTINLATPVGKGFVIFTILVLLSLPLMGIWAILEEYTPMAISVTEDSLVATHLKEEYQVPVNLMEDLQVIQELPSWSKISGTGLDNLCKGSFNVREYGRCQVFVNPQNSLFLQFQVDGTMYYFSGPDDSSTEEVYQELLTRFSK